MVYGLSNDPLEALKGMKQKGVTQIPVTPNVVAPTGVPTAPQSNLADIGGYSGGIAGVTTPTIGSSFSQPAGADQTAIINMPTEIQRKIGQDVQNMNGSGTQTGLEQGPQFTDTIMANEIQDTSPVDLYADLKAGMPISELPNYYPEYAQNQALINDLKADIDAGMPEVAIQQYYPELYAKPIGTAEQQRGGGLKGMAASESPINMGVGERANPVGRVAEIIDNTVQKIGAIDFKAPREEQLNQRIASLTQKELEAYQKSWEKYKKDNPTLSKLYTKRYEGDNILSQMWNVVTGNSKTDEVAAFKDFVKESEKTYLDQFFGVGDQGPNVPTMLANVPGSALKTATAIARAVTNPADTLAGLGKLIFTQEGRQMIIDRYGSLEAFAKTLETDPIGVASDVLAIVEGGAGLVKSGAKLTAGIAAKVGATETAKLATNVAKTAGEVSKTAGIASDLGMRQLIPTQLSNLAKATEKIPVVGKVVKYGQAVTTPLDSLVNISKPLTDKIPTAEDTVQRMNRISASNQAKFVQQQGMPVGERLNKNIGPKNPVETVSELGNRVRDNIKQVDTAVEGITGPQRFKATEYTNQYGDVLKYQGDAIADMADDGVQWAIETKNPLLPVFQELRDKYARGDATMTDINKLQRLYQQNTKMGYFKDMTAGSKTQKSTNIDSAVREWKMQVGEENGFENFREINKDTQASMSIIKGLEKRQQGRLGNDAVTLTDWIMIAPAMIEPTHVAGLVTKKILQSNWFAKNYAKIVNKLNNHTVLAQKAADMALISKISNEKEFSRWLMGEEQKELLKPALPEKAQTNIGTTKNPIVSKGEIKVETEMTGRRRKTVGQSDAPQKGDMTKLGKVVDTQYTGGGFGKNLVKIDGYKDFIPIEKIEGGIWEQPKGMKPKAEVTVGDFAKEMQETATPMTKKADIGKMGMARTVATDAIADELGYKDFKSIDNEELKTKIAEIARMRDVEKTIKAVESLKADLSSKSMKNDNTNSSSSDSTVRDNDSGKLKQSDTKEAVAVQQGGLSRGSTGIEGEVLTKEQVNESIRLPKEKVAMVEAVAQNLQLAPKNMLKVKSKVDEGGTIEAMTSKITEELNLDEMKKPIVIKSLETQKKIGVTPKEKVVMNNKPTTAVEQGGLFAKKETTETIKDDEMLKNEKELLVRDQKELARLNNYLSQFPGTKKPVQISDIKKLIKSREQLISYIEKKKAGAFDNLEEKAPDKPTYDLKKTIESADDYYEEMQKKDYEQQVIEETKPMVRKDAVRARDQENMDKYGTTRPTANDIAAYERNNAPKQDTLLSPEAKEVLSMEEQIQANLNEKQKNKVLSVDLGERVSGSKKEKAQYKKLTIENLTKVEGESAAMAYDLVTKDRVIEKYDPVADREAGVDSGVIFMKKKLLDAISKKPDDSAFERSMYVKVVPEIADKIKAATTLAELNDLSSKFKVMQGWSGSKVANDIFMDGVEGALTGVVGQRFVTLLKSRNEAGALARIEANQLNRLTETQRGPMVDKVSELYRTNIASYQKELVDLENPITAKPLIESYKEMQKKWYSKPSSYTDEEIVGLLKQRANMHILENTASMNKKIKTYVGEVRDNNWERMNEKQSVEKVKSGMPTIHTYTKIDNVERIGGREIDKTVLKSPEKIRDQYGYKTVQFGNYMTDKSALYHIENFLASMTDLQDTIGIDINKINRETGLSLAFGARGSGGAAAHYESLYNIINLTKNGGAGSVAHERSHFLDNTLGSLLGVEKKQGRSYLTESLDTKATYRDYYDYANKERIAGPRENIKALVTELMSKMTGQGSSVITKTFDIPVEKATTYPSIRRDFEKGGIELAMKNIAPYIKGSKANTRAKDYYGYLAQLAQKPITATIEVEGSKYYNDAKDLGVYWKRPVELFARAWEAYIQDAMMKQGKKNNYLVSNTVGSQLYFDKMGEARKYDVYPQGLEREKFNTFFDRILEELKKEYGVTLPAPIPAPIPLSPKKII